MFKYYKSKLRNDLIHALKSNYITGVLNEAKDLLSESNDWFKMEKKIRELYIN